MYRLLYGLPEGKNTGGSVQQNIILYGGLLLLLFAIVYILFVVLARNRQNHLIQQQLTMQKDFALQLMQVQAEVQEETMNSLSKELHDNIGQLLSSTKVLLGITQRNLQQVPDTLTTAEETLGTAINELRALSRSMSREWLEQFNLEENLLVEIKRLNTIGDFKVNMNNFGQLNFLSNDQQLVLFRIIQECLQNAVKHASATLIQLSFQQVPSEMVIIISDNGTGFTENLNNPEGLGLINIKHRTYLLGGKVTWQSTPLAGTTVSIQLPIKTA